MVIHIRIENRRSKFVIEFHMWGGAGVGMRSMKPHLNGQMCEVIVPPNRGSG